MASIVRTFPKLYLIGDSNTQQSFQSTGFGVKLQEDFVRICDVVNRGFSGYTSQDLCMVLPNLLQFDNSNESIKIATILLGSNDAVSQSLDKRHSPVHVFKKCIDDIIKQLQKAGVPHIILISPPPVDVKHWKNYSNETYGSHGGFSLDSENTKDYAEACREIAVQFPEIQFLDLYNSILETENWKDLFGDGLHFNEAGSQLVYTKLKEKIGPIVEEFPMVYPDWKLIDQDDHAKSIL